MPDLPKYAKTKTIRHEFTIGRSDRPTTAKDFEFGILAAKRRMEELGVMTDNDDAYFVIAGDGGEVILYVDEEKD